MIDSRRIDEIRRLVDSPMGPNGRPLDMESYYDLCYILDEYENQRTRPAKDAPQARGAK